LRTGAGKVPDQPGQRRAGRQSATEQFATLIEMACRYEKPVRIGVNWGSLDQELLARVMDDSAGTGMSISETVTVRLGRLGARIGGARGKPWVWREIASCSRQGEAASRI